MVEQEELRYTTSSGGTSSEWEVWPTSDSSTLSAQIGGRYMGLQGLEPITSTYTNFEEDINRQLGNMFGQAAEDYQGYRMRLRRVRRLRRQMDRLPVQSRDMATQFHAHHEQNRLQQEINALNQQITAYERFIEEGGFYSDDDIIN